MKHYLKFPLIYLAVTVVLSMFTSCQTESISDEEEFSSKNSQSDKTLVSEKLVALYSTRNGTYISSENGNNVTCNRDKIGSWETLTMITWEDGRISFKGNNGLFLSDENGKDNIKFNRKEAGLWEKFTYDGNTITRGDKLMLNGSNENVNFNGGVYRDFDIIELPMSDSNIVSEKSVALYSIRNGTYISSENGGNVTCNRKKVGLWETITMVTWTDGTISFKGNNGLYLSDGHGDVNIQFEKEVAGTYEKFTYDGRNITSVWDGESTLNGSNYDVVFNKDGVYQDFSIIEL